MIAQPKLETLELGYFLDFPDDCHDASFAALVTLIEDGVIEPDLLGRASFSSFLEFPYHSGGEADTLSCGLGFSQAFLEAQGVTPVQYIPVEAGQSLPAQNDLKPLLRGWKSFDYQRRPATLADASLADPEGNVQEIIIEYEDSVRLYFQAAPAPSWAYPGEWRGASPVRFTIDDIQTVYLPTPDDVITFHYMYPTYRGRHVVLD